jgi:hypothetical protein
MVGAFLVLPWESFGSIQTMGVSRPWGVSKKGVVNVVLCHTLVYMDS